MMVCKTWWGNGNLDRFTVIDVANINIDALGGLCGDDDEYDLLARRELVVVWQTRSLPGTASRFDLGSTGPGRVGWLREGVRRRRRRRVGWLRGEGEKWSQLMGERQPCTEELEIYLTFMREDQWCIKKSIFRSCQGSLEMICSFVGLFLYFFDQVERS